MFRNLNGNAFTEEHTIPQAPLLYEPRRLCRIQEETYSMECAYLTSEVPDMDVDVDLLCDEVIDDWDEIDDYTNMKSREKPPGLNSNILPISPQDPESEFHVYADETPNNSPATGVPQETPLFYLQNRYVNSLLQIWRDNLDASELLQRSLESRVADSEESDDVSMPSNSDPSSQISEAASETEDLGSSNVNNNNHSLTNIFEAALSGNGTLLTSNVNDEAEHSMSPEPDWHTPAIDNDLSTELDHELARAMSPYNILNRSSISFSPRLRTSYRNFRSVSPHILRSPSPILSNSSSPRFLQSPGLDDLHTDLSLDYIDTMVMPEGRYPRSRSRSPLSGLQQVPDADTELYEAAPSSDEFPVNYRRHRMMNSCQDQVVPEYIEE